MANPKELKYGANARELLLQGVDYLADAVQVTLGPRGRIVALESKYGPPLLTKDGVTVAKGIDQLSDPIATLGALMIKDVASQTSDAAGDGTTTATVLARKIVREGNKCVVAGMNPMDLKRGIDKAVSAAVAELKKLSMPCKDEKTIAQVGTISANADV